MSRAVCLDRRLAAVAIATVVMTAGLALREMLGLWLAVGSGAALAAVAVLVAVGRPRARAWSRPTPASLVAGTVTGLAMGGATHALYTPVVRAVPAARQEVDELYALIDAGPGPLAAFPIVVVVIIAEELVFRGALMDVLSERMRGSVGIVLTASAVYVLPQLGVGSWLLMLVAFGCGIVWSALRHWTGTLVAPTVAHLLWDLVVFVLFPLA